MTEEMQTLKLRDNFYRDSFSKLMGIILAAAISVGLMIAMSVYLYVIKPPPITFMVGDEWRIQSPVPVDQPYRTTADMLQWVSDVLPNSFNYDFINYDKQLQGVNQYFTANGWKAFLNQLNNYVNYNTVQTNKLFVNGAPASAPFVLNQGLILGRYGWWVQIPITITAKGNKNSEQNLVFQVLVVRVPTLNNLSGIGIDNVIVVRNPEASKGGGG